LWSIQARSYTEKVMNNALLIAQQDGDQALYDAIQLVASRALQTRLGQQAQPAAKPNSELERLRRERTERQQADAEKAFDTFWNQTDQEVIDSTVSSIASIIKKALPKASEVTLGKMVKDAYDKTLELMNAQPQTLSQINAYRNAAQKGKQGIADHKAIVAYITGRAKLVVPNATKGVINQWSGQILKLNQDKTDKQKDIAARTKDVGSGPQGTSSAAGAVPVKTGANRHTKDVFAEIEAGTYRR
jgi:hypothetical protein